MREITNEEFSTAMMTADEHIKTLMGSSELLEVLENKLEKLSSSVSADDLLMPFGYYFLKLFSSEELLAILDEYQVPQAKDFVSSVTSMIRNSTGANVLAENEIAEIEAALQSIPPVRTMATDMQQVQARESGEYVSNQDAILNRDEETPITPPTDPDEARWNSTSPY